MNGKSVVAAVVVVVAAGVLSGAALAEGDGKRGRHGERGFSALAEYVGLTPEQREQFKTMQEEHRKEAEPLRVEGRELHEKLRAALESEKADEAAVGKAMLAMKDHREKMKASHEAFRARMRAQLTPEQAQKLDAFEAARRFDQRGRRPRHAPGRPNHPELGPGGAPGIEPEDELPPPPIQG
jgi:Spy/CpxP family protein refolding chaperone